MFKLDKGRAKYNLCKYYFTNRVVNVCLISGLTLDLSSSPMRHIG